MISRTLILQIYLFSSVSQVICQVSILTNRALQGVWDSGKQPAFMIHNTASKKEISKIV